MQSFRSFLELFRLTHTPTLFWQTLNVLGAVDLFLDVGSLDGTQSLEFEQKYPSTQCIAFEASPRNISLISKRIKAEQSSVQLMDVAVSNFNGYSSFFVEIPKNGKNHGTSSLYLTVNPNADSLQEITVKTCRLDSLAAVQNSERIALWIDAEGASYEVLEGLGNLLRKVVVIHVEVDSKKMRHGQKLASDVIDYLKGFDHRILGSDFNYNTETGFVVGNILTIERRLVSWRIWRPYLIAWTIYHMQIQQILYRLLPYRVYQWIRSRFIEFL